MSTPSLEELTRFGITPDDEHPHPFSPEYEWWNESVFYDWYDADGANAGHCRIGWHPNQQRLWMWLFLFNGAEWVAIEEPRLPLSSLKLPEIAYDDGWGLRFSYTVDEALRRGRFAARGFGRVLCGPRAGMILPVAVELDVETVGAAHSLGQQHIPGHSAEGYSTSRFEQPIRARGTLRHRRRDARARRARRARPLVGPALVEHRVELLRRATATTTASRRAHVRVPGASEINTGYLHVGEATRQHHRVTLDLAFDDANATRPVSGRFAFTAEGGATLPAASNRSPRRRDRHHPHLRPAAALGVPARAHPRHPGRRPADGRLAGVESLRGLMQRIARVGDGCRATLSLWADNVRVAAALVAAWRCNASPGGVAARHRFPAVVDRPRATAPRSHDGRASTASAQSPARRVVCTRAVPAGIHHHPRGG